jgi:TolA-binding protein
MRKKITALSLVYLGVASIGFAQESKIYTHDDRQYQEALALYHNKQYQAAQTLFDKVRANTGDTETEANSAYYVANAAVRLNQLGADRLMEDFVTRYPTSTKRNSAFLDVADYYFENGKYPYALKWYNKVDQSAMARKDLERFNFSMGYALYASKKPEEAERYLNKVANSPTYGSQAKYYLGFIAYQEDDYEEASARFDQITDQDVLDEKLSYFQADMNFKLGNFEEAIALAKKQLPMSDRKEISELNKIIGESYFNMEQYAEAIPYLEQYKGKRGKWNNTDFYLLGYCYYKQTDYANAILQFNKIIGGANSVSQNAYYHLAECYLKLNKKQEALNAFRNASQMDFSAEIQKDAYLNYARLSYEIGNAYEPVSEVLANYLKKYPGDDFAKELQELLVDSYITSKNFKGALVLLEENRNYASKATYQKVAFYRGVEVFLETNYSEAIEVFSKAIDNAADEVFTARSQYWKAESQYLLNRFDEALVGFIQFQQNSASKSTAEYDELDYNLGYTYFKLKDYNTATTYFKKFSEKDRANPMAQNALVRLGDCYFVTSKYQPAIDAYSTYIERNGAERDYAAFQKAISYGFVGQNATKLKELKSFISRFPSSTLKDDVLFELGNSYIRDNKEQEGLEAYDQMIREYNGSRLVPQALLRQGLVHYNASRNEQALVKFKSVVKDFPNTQEAIQAVATAKLVYVDMGRVSEYGAWVRELDFVEVSNSELDNATFESANKQYLEGKEQAAVRGFENYLKDFPSGMHIVDAHFSLAQLYFAKGENGKALPSYKFVADRGGNEYAEQALARVCEILIGTDSYSEAIPYLEQLELTADITQNRTYAQSNLMKGYYEQDNYDRTLLYAEKVLTTKDIDDRIKSDAHIMIARSAMKTSNEDRAEEAYSQVLKIATGVLAAEALYYDAFFKNKQGDFEASNSSVQKLAKDYATYKEWGGKGLILMAKNFDGLQDAFQATYILESVIENFTQYPEIITEAQEVLSKIKIREAERNSSVKPDGN